MVTVCGQFTQSAKYANHQNDENIPCESHRVCSEQEAAANLDQEVDICTPTPAVQCYHTTRQIMYNQAPQVNPQM